MSCVDYLVQCEDPYDPDVDLDVEFFVDETLCWTSNCELEWTVLKVPSRKYLLWYFESENLENGRLFYNEKIYGLSLLFRATRRHALPAIVPFGDRFEFMDGRHRSLWVDNQSRDNNVLLAVATTIAERVESDIWRMDETRELNGHLVCGFFWFNMKHISIFRGQR